MGAKAAIPLRALHRPKQAERDLARLVESRRIITVLVTPPDVDQAIALADRIFVLSRAPCA